MSEALLETRRLCRDFGALAAVLNVDFRLDAGTRHALIGPNGAGKTTLVNLLSGALPPSRGEVRLKGRDVTGVVEADRVKLGIARTFQINRLFRGLSVLEVLDAVDTANGSPVKRVMECRRPGDSPMLVAANSTLLGTLDWRPENADIGEIVRTALDWERRLLERPR